MSGPNVPKMDPLAVRALVVVPVARAALCLRAASGDDDDSQSTPLLSDEV
jgi:hypothetical protein